MTKVGNEDEDEGSEDLSSSSSSTSKEDELEEAEEEAASFISLQLLHTTFAPIFTHQCFENEVIFGYTPLLSSPSLKEEDECEEEEEEERKEQLAIRVILSPSCRSCVVSIIIRNSNDAPIEEEKGKDEEHGEKGIDSSSQEKQMEEEKIEKETKIKGEEKKVVNVLPMSIIKKRPRKNEKSHDDKNKDVLKEEGGEKADTSEPMQKKQKKNVDSSKDEESNKANNGEELRKKKQEKRVQFGDSDTKHDKENKSEDNDSNGSTKKRMKVNEIYKRISKALPPILNKLPPSQTNQQQQQHDNNEEEEITITPTKEQINQVQNDYLSKPFGTIVKEYNRQTTNNDEKEKDTFVLTLANGTNNASVATYHSSIQNLSLWFIESASTSDILSDEGGGYWKVLYLFRKHSSSTSTNAEKYSLVGYTTLFHFYSPFKKPKAGIVMRICQVLVLPLYQRCGHGKKMLQAVYDVAAGLYGSVLKQDNGDDGDSDGMLLLREVVEVNVEDPAPAFTCLRDCVDYECLRDSLVSLSLDDKKKSGSNNGDNEGKASSTDNTNENKENGTSSVDKPTTKAGAIAPMIDAKLLTGDIMDPTYFTPLSEADAIQCGLSLRITPRQVQIVYEIYKLDALERKIKELGQDDETKEEKEKTIEMLQKRYRLMVKKRLNKLHQEDLGLRKSKKEKQEKLAEYYEEVLKHYLGVLGRK